MKDIDQILTNIEMDRVSGSSSLVDRLIQSLLNLAPSLTQDNKIIILEKVERLSESKPFFAVLRHFTEALKETDMDWLVFLNEYVSHYQHAGNKITEEFISLSNPQSKVFLSHSHSKTITSVFETMAQSKIKVKILQTISHPEKEGVIQAKHLSDSGHEVRLIADDPPALNISEVDYFVTGADLILSSHFINKSGTQLIAEKIHQSGKPYFVVTDKRKFSTINAVALPPYLERIPRTLITKMITGE